MVAGLRSDRTSQTVARRPRATNPRPSPSARPPSVRHRVRQGECPPARVSRQSVHWYKRWHAPTRRSAQQGPTGHPAFRPPFHQVEQALLKGAGANGFGTRGPGPDRRRSRAHRVRHPPGLGGRCHIGLAGMSSGPVRGRRRTRTPSTAGQERWPADSAKPTTQSLPGSSPRPRSALPRTSAAGPRSAAPVLEHRFNGKASMRPASSRRPRWRAQLCFPFSPANYNTVTHDPCAGLAAALPGVERPPCCGTLPSHRSRAMQAWLHTQRHWLVVNAALLRESQPFEGLLFWRKAASSQPRCPTPGGVGRRSRHRARPADSHLLSFSAVLACRSHDLQATTRTL